MNFVVAILQSSYLQDICVEMSSGFLTSACLQLKTDAEKT